MTQKGVSSSAHWTRAARTPRSRASTAVCSRARDTCDCDSVATGEGVLRMLQRTRDAGGTHRIQVIAWQSVLQTGLWHSDPFQRSLRDIPAWRRGLLSALWHGASSHNHLSGIPAWRRSHLSGLRHGDPAYKHLSGILAWQRSHLSGLWQGDPFHRCLSGILAEPL